MGRRAREDRAEIIAEFERSALTQEAFAARRGIPVSTLRSWIYRGRRGPAVAGGAQEPRLVPVRVVAAPAPEAPGSGGLLELAIGGRLTLRFPAGTDARYLAELVAAVG